MELVNATTFALLILKEKACFLHSFKFRVLLFQVFELLKLFKFMGSNFCLHFNRFLSGRKFDGEVGDERAANVPCSVHFSTKDCCSMTAAR